MKKTTIVLTKKNFNNLNLFIIMLELTNAFRLFSSSMEKLLVVHAKISKQSKDL